MNDPHVKALIYAVRHESRVTYDKAGPIERETDQFRITVENEKVRIAFKDDVHYATEDDAIKGVRPYILSWELDALLTQGPGVFNLEFVDSEVIDRNPTPGHIHVRPGRVRFDAEGSVLSAKLDKGRYPDPPSEGTFDAENDSVQLMAKRYEMYRRGKTTLPDAAYFCLTMLEKNGSGRKAAANKYGIDFNVLRKVGELTGKRGGVEARKAEGSGTDLTEEEKKFLEYAMREMIRKAAKGDLSSPPKS